MIFKTFLTEKQFHFPFIRTICCEAGVNYKQLLTQLSHHRCLTSAKYGFTRQITAHELKKFHALGKSANSKHSKRSTWKWLFALTFIRNALETEIYLQYQFIDSPQTVLRVFKTSPRVHYKFICKAHYSVINF